ncbi:MULTISPECIES: lysophospholipid acyltransferase family protein [Legionella]|uniref:lysophospholipid acyltransferase family protein n=1 Tax=Legionella TaxID=445 RepID=UPI002353FDDF|nr:MULTISPECIES: lysophospholipid acyltransferase family protein [Legionella]
MVKFINHENQFVPDQGVVHMYSHFDQNNDDSFSSAYMQFILLTGLALATCAVILKYAESKNRLNYEDRFARVAAGLLVLMMRMMHTKSGDLEIDNTKDEGSLIAIGPHQSGLVDAAVVASKMQGKPPRFFATTGFNGLPGVARFLKMFQTIPVEATAKKGEGRTANAGAIEKASEVLKEKGCVALFPQGNFSRIGQEPPRVYTGVAKLALMNNMPIQVIRLDGFWSLQNPLIPLFVRNSAAYRAFATALHMNNVRATLCCVIDFHLKPDSEKLTEEEKVEEICAQLYAFYRHTQELSPKQIEEVKKEITNGAHRKLWDMKVQREKLGKEIVSLKKEEEKLEEATFASMTLS